MESKPNLTITPDDSDQKEQISPTFCTVDGCYRVLSKSPTKLCTEHEAFSTLQYIVKHKPQQSPVAASKYKSEQGGLSCVQMYTE
jgi:hypothetical protein